ncbi:MAG: HIT domain-containing protein [Nitrosopumilus sp.]
MTCIFCDILSGNREGHFLYQDENHVAFLDKYPIDHGHSLVIPRNHHERITEMTPENVGKLFSIVPKIAKAILDATGADAFSLAQNNGREAKQIIPHVHIHIIPRYKNKGTVWTKREISKSEELEKLSLKIKNFI